MSKIFKAFTLIELLVVIAIIGILSGLIVVSMSGVTNKATIAKAQVFSNSLRNSLMANIVGEWKLDEISGTAANDTWGGLNNGSLAGFVDTTAGYGDTHTSGWASSSNCISGTCLNFDGIDDFINLGVGSSLQMGTGSITVSMWYKPTLASASYQQLFYGGALGGHTGYGVGIRNSSIRIEVYGTTGGRQTMATGVLADLNTWQHIVVVFDAVNYIANIYKNGVFSVPITFVNWGTATNANNFYIGTHNGGAFIYSGFVDNTRIYNAVMPTSQIKEQYYTGLNKMLNSGNISKEDYLNKIAELAIK